MSERAGAPDGEANQTPGLSGLRRKRRGWILCFMPAAQRFRDPCVLWAAVYRAGLHFWQLGESLLGHNAIIRVKPFIEHCALAPAAGEGSFADRSFPRLCGGANASGGVGRLDCLPCSRLYEELPPNLLDELKRDRRWCRGNLMNFRLFGERNAPVHRAVFLTG